jgi:cytochrome c oxidase assembly protein subunit 15
VRRSQNNPALSVFAVLTAVATLCLICVGGLVTSHGAGMAVPDWPTSYGYNMFLFPISQWVGGIFYEHTHRLVASGVGLLTTILAVWLWIKEERRWLRWLGVFAWLAVCVQGVLGGLRVTLYKQELGIFHATLAQLFLLSTCAIAFFLSKTWQNLALNSGSIRFHRWFRPVALLASVLILAQLVLGATMRHQHAGLAVPDFPLAYGGIWPRTDDAFIQQINLHRTDYRDFAPITANQIYLHMAHRLNACLVLLAVSAAGMLLRKGQNSPKLKLVANAWLALILFQAFLGAYTVWSNKAADIATAHVAIGALSLVWGGLLYIGTAPLAAKVHRKEEVSVAHAQPALS